MILTLKAIHVCYFIICFNNYNTLVKNRIHRTTKIIPATSLIIFFDEVLFIDILPFLEKQQIPVTLFVNPKYLDGVSKREGYTDNPQYILKEDLWNLKSPLITIGMHGYEHNDATRMTKEEFLDSVERCKKNLESHPRYIPYYAYTWGNYSEMTQQVLCEKRIVPVLTDGESNYRYRQGIGRKPIDSYYLNKISVFN